VAPALGVIHFIWSVKRDVREPVTYGLVLASLLVVRIAYHLLARSPQLQRSSCMQHASLRREQAPVLFASHAEQKCTRAVVGGENGGGHPEFGAHVGDDVPIHSRKNRNDASFSASTPNWRADQIFTSLPIDPLDRFALKRRIKEIGKVEPPGNA
jgi:hypothetical protein